MRAAGTAVFTRVLVLLAPFPLRFLKRLNVVNALSIRDPWCEPCMPAHLRDGCCGLASQITANRARA